MMTDTNSKMKCLVVDDESIAVRGIINHIEKIDFLELTDIASSAMEASSKLKEHEIDLMFLDINMPHLSGLEFLESLDKTPMTIFTTAYSEYALDGYRLNVVDYLLKPISFDRFFQAATRAHESFHSKLLVNEPSATAPDVYIRQKDTFKRIIWNDILYVEAMQNYLKLYFKNEVLTIHQTMVSLEEMLPPQVFYRIHKSYLVNVSHISSIANGHLCVNGAKLPISKHRRNDLLNTVVYKNLISK